MENNFFQIKKTKENIQFLKENGFSKLQAAIFDRKAERLLLISQKDRSFWVTCPDGIKDASKTIKVAFNKTIDPLHPIENILNH
jgi:hypothetical protein